MHLPIVSFFFILNPPALAAGSPALAAGWLKGSNPLWQQAASFFLFNLPALAAGWLNESSPLWHSCPATLKITSQESKVCSRLRSCLKLYSQIIAYTAALPIQELHQVRNYTACTFDPPPAFLARFPSSLSPKWTTGIKHAGLRWLQVLMFHPQTLNTCIWAVAAGWEGSGILRRSPTRSALMREVRKQWRLAERMGCRVIRGRRRTSPLPSCSVEVADPEVW
ncbi:hypothetical protein B0H13DRAFT_1893582 [Mycena leptocephala]|nr:hypothetical protein B0H13DRAFT_1893582 [Mycena leptocephala]